MQQKAGAPLRLHDRLRQLWSGNKQLRLLLTLGLAVMLPAAALIYINFYQLQSIERDKALEAAIHRDFQQMLAISEKQINQDAYAKAEAARDLFALPSGKDSSRREAMLDGVLSQSPWFANVFLFDQDDGLVVRSQPHRIADAAFRREHEQLAKVLGPWLSREADKFLAGMRKKGRSMIWLPDRSEGDATKYATVAYFTIPGLATDRVVIGGARFDPAYLQQTFLPKALEELVTYKLGEESGTPLAMAITSVAPGHAASSPGLAWTSDAVLASSAGWHTGTPEVSRNLDDVFRGLTLGIRFQGTSVEAIGRNWAYRSFLILGVLSVLLVGGLVLTYRSVHKEVALSRLKSDFVSNVSHELRTPLSLIRLYAETLELGRIRSPERMQAYYATIRLESERLTALIDNILDFSRIEAGRKQYEFRMTDMAELVVNTLETYRAQIDEQGFTFEQRIEPGLPLMRVDREAVARSLVNLVNNALKYSDRERFLSVRLYRTDGEIKLEVVDRGIGIPRSEQAKILEKFYRTGDTLVHNTKGSGLGLSLVRHIARAHGGEVRVQSVLGQGSTFTLSLPVDVPVTEPAGSAA